MIHSLGTRSVRPTDGASTVTAGISTARSDVTMNTGRSDGFVLRRKVPVTLTGVSSYVRRFTLALSAYATSSSSTFNTCVPRRVMESSAGMSVPVSVWVPCGIWRGVPGPEKRDHATMPATSKTTTVAMICALRLYMRALWSARGATVNHEKAHSKAMHAKSSPDTMGRGCGIHDSKAGCGA